MNKLFFRGSQTVAIGVLCGYACGTEAGVPSVESLTLLMMIEQGGILLWLIVALAFVTLAWSLYLLATVRVKREVPATLVKRAHAQVRNGDLRGAYQMCQGRDEILSNVLRAGLKAVGQDRFAIQEAMESAGGRGAAVLWQRIGWIKNIATIAPLLGLLGTVWAIMQVFGAIAYESAEVKQIAMANGISMALVTTEAGLALSVPAMAVYFYLHGRVVRIIVEVESQASEFIELLSRTNPE